jgi:hypothetical protein
LELPGIHLEVLDFCLGTEAAILQFGDKPVELDSEAVFFLLKAFWLKGRGSFYLKGLIHDTSFKSQSTYLLDVIICQYYSLLL